MQIDERLLHEVEHSSEPRTVIRFYQWALPTVSLGKNQKPEQVVDLEYCRKHSIPVVHRPTGGRAVLHANELTYAVVSNDADCFPIHSVHGTYLKIARALKEGFQALGICTQLKRTKLGTDPNFPFFGENGVCPQFFPPCFASPSRHELVHKGRKIAGSAQRRLRKSFLQHGSIPLEVDYEVMEAALGVDQNFLRSTMVSVLEAAHRSITFDELLQALMHGFEDVFACDFCGFLASNQRGML